MVDTWASVGSCAQIGKNVHLSGGVGIGGVLEPMQAGPTIIEDDCFIGARSEVVEGCIVREGSVLGMGVFIGQSTKIVDRATGEVFYGEVPANSVVVAGALPGKPLPNGEPGPSLYCAVIVKRVDAKDAVENLDQRTAARLIFRRAKRPTLEARAAPARERKSRLWALQPRRGDMDWKYLLTSFEGRINRGKFWAAYGIMIAAFDRRHHHRQCARHEFRGDALRLCLCPRSSV